MLALPNFSLTRSFLYREQVLVFRLIALGSRHKGLADRVVLLFDCHCHLEELRPADFLLVLEADVASGLWGRGRKHGFSRHVLLEKLHLPRGAPAASAAPCCARGTRAVFFWGEGF